MDDRTTPVFLAIDEALRHRAAVIFQAEAAGIKPETVGLQPLTLQELDALFQILARAAALYRAYDGPAPAGPRLNTWRQFLARAASLSSWAVVQHGLACAREGVPIAGRARSVQDGFEYVWQLFATWPDYNPRTVDEPQIVARLSAGIGQALVIPTEKSREDLQRIFRELAEAGYIDGSAPDAEADFLAVFDAGAGRQGCITWTRRGKNKALNKRSICDFLLLFGVEESAAVQAYSRAVFGVEIDDSTISRARSDGSAERFALKTIIDP